jgi:hypothetical protein
MAASGESPEFIQSTLASLRSIEGDYRPNAAVSASLGQRSMIALAGAISSGTSTVTTEITLLDTDFKEVITTTTRPPKYDDQESLSASVGYADFHESVLAGEFVNFGLIGGHAYGTHETGLPGSYNVGPIMSQSILQLLESPLRDINVVSLLVQEQEYERRLRLKRAEGIDLEPNIGEARALRSFLESHIDEHWLHFIESPADSDGATKVARKIIQIANHNTGEFMTNDRALVFLQGMDNALHRVARNVH